MLFRLNHLTSHLRLSASHSPSNTTRLFTRAMTTTKYHAIIIGSGQSGTPLASAFAKAGHKTALIERTHIGGCCVNEGCTPTKTLISSGRVAYLSRRGRDYGIHSQEKGNNEVVVDMLKVRQRKRDIVESFRGGNEGRLKEAGVDVIMGEASFVDKETVKVIIGNGKEVEVKAEKIFINTGERPVPPKLEGIEHVDKNMVLDSTSVMELDVVPAHLVVIGGGYVGVEFAQLFRRLGAEVTILQRGGQLLPREDKEIADSLLDILREDGLTIHLNTEASSIKPPSSGSASFELTIRSKPSNTQVLNGSHILFASGRIPNTDSLNLSAAGISTNSRGYITATPHLETSTPNIYALGDVKGPPAFTHISYDDFRIIRSNLLSPSPPSTLSSTTNRQVPYVVYTDPQLGHIGVHEAEARSLFPNKKIKTAKMPMSYVARALETDESRGMMKAVVDEESGEILGFTVLGLEGGELMAVVQVAMMGKVGYKELENAVFAHPSLAECLNNLWRFLE